MAERGERAGSLWSPVALLAVATLVAFAAVRGAAPALAGKAVPAYAACLVLGPGVLYAVLRRRGAPPRRAAALALVVPLLWSVKECFAIWRVFRWREAVYYAFNPLALGLFTAAALEMALAELVLHRTRTGRWRLANGAVAVVLVIAALAVAYAVVAARRGPSFIFWLYISTYRDFVAG